MSNKPVKTAVVQRDAADEELVAEEVSKYKLSDLSREFRFFTTAVLYAVIPGLDRDLVKEFLRSQPDPRGLLGTVDTKKFFRGVGSLFVAGQLVDYDARLYAVRHAIWDTCRDFIASSRFICPKAGLCQVLLYDLMISEAGCPDKIPVAVFGVNNNSGFYFFNPAPVLGCFDLTRSEPYSVAELQQLPTL